MTERSAIAQIVAMVSTAYPHFGERVTPQTYEVYFRLLGDIPEDELRAAVLQCLTEEGRKFAPSVGEIRGAVSSIRQHQYGIPTGYEAWSEVLSAPRDGKKIVDVFQKEEKWYIREEPYTWSSPLVLQTAKMFGWPKFPDGENMVADRARFLEAYSQMVDRALRNDMRLPEVTRYIAQKAKARLEAK